MPLTPKDRRATVLSTMEQADSISQVTIGPAMGVIGQVAGIPAALATSAALLAPSALAVRHAGANRCEGGPRAREDRRVIFDPELVRRIESSAARVSMATVAGFIGHAADDPARAVAFGDGALIAFGPGRYVNRAVGISLDDIGDDGVDELEAFYAASGVPPSLEVASWAPAALVARLGRRGYVVEWFRNVYVSEVDGHVVPPHPSMAVREVDARDDPGVAGGRAGGLRGPDARRGRRAATRWPAPRTPSPERRPTSPTSTG